MKLNLYILLVLQIILAAIPAKGQSISNTLKVDFFGEALSLPVNASFHAKFDITPTPETIQDFYATLSASDHSALVNSLLNYKQKTSADDWLYYQLIRKVSQLISPKLENYHRYTLYKWFLLTASGYDAILTTSGQKLLFYVRSDENIYNIPTRIENGKQYVCLNYHDLSTIDFSKEIFTAVPIRANNGTKLFSYQIKQLPDFQMDSYVSRDLRFNYNEIEYSFKVKINPQVKTIFANYPVVDYASYINIPLSKETYNSLVPLLKKNIKRLSTKNGIDYLMRFTRYAFNFEPDVQQFGGEKRLSPEQTLMYDNSDCEDRVALFFFLVKEIYDLPMLVLAYPKHVTIAVKLDNPLRNSIVYNGSHYSICEPSPQLNDLTVGESLPALKSAHYEVAYVYTPNRK